MLNKKLRAMFLPFTTRVGIFFGRFASPNAYTAITLIFGLLAAYLVAVQQPLHALVALAVSGFFDLVDGAVAKVTSRATKWGAFFDAMTDKTTELLLYIGVAFAYPALSIPVLLTVSAYMLSSYASKHAGVFGLETGGGLIERKERLILLMALLAALWQAQAYAAPLLYLLALLSALTALQRIVRTKKALGDK